MTACCQAQAGLQRKNSNKYVPFTKPILSAKHEPTDRVGFKVEGMTCNACLQTVKTAVHAMGTVEEIIDADLSTGMFQIQLKMPLPPEGNMDMINSVKHAV